jgi:hypothetical protein
MYLYWFDTGTQVPKHASHSRVNCGPVYVGFVIDTVTLGHASLRVLLIYTVSIIQLPLTL